MTDVGGSIERTITTVGHHGYDVAFSPFSPDLIAVAAAQNFGLMGGGCVCVVSVGEQKVLSSGNWESSGLLDVAWSEATDGVLVTVAGDGSMQLWNTSNLQSPVTVWCEHSKDACSVSWSQTRDVQHIVSASWDSSIKVWDPNQKSSVRTLVGGGSLVYQAVWSPYLPGCVASVAEDGGLRIWNTRGKSNQPNMTIRACEGEALSCDWCKYDQNIIATSGTDRNISIWDLRKPTQPIFVLTGHNYPPRRIKFSSFLSSQLASVSYDFTTRIWDYKESQECVKSVERHTEFVYGVDYCPHGPLLADCGWDQKVNIYDLSSLSPPTPPPPT